MAARRPDGWWYPWIFVLGMAVVIAVNGVLIFSAIETFSGLRTENAYNKGLKYNDTLAAAAEQQRLGWRSEVSLAPDGAGTGERRFVLVATLKDRDGRPLSGLAARAYLSRPTVGGHDVETPLAEQGEGRYVADVNLPLPGLWDVRVHAHRGTDNFQDARRVSVP